MDRLAFFIVALFSAVYAFLLASTQTIARALLKMSDKRKEAASSDGAKQHSATSSELRSELARIDGELRNVSMIHEFAKYQKAKRRRNALEDELSRVSATEADRLSVLERRVRFLLYGICVCFALVLGFAGSANDDADSSERAYLFPFDSLSLSSWFVMCSLTSHTVLRCLTASVSVARKNALSE